MGVEPQTLRTERLEGAQRERIWATTEAHEWVKPNKGT